MTEDWYISKEGAEKFKIASQFCGNGSDRFGTHLSDKIFEKEIRGFKVTQHIDLEEKHAVMLIEGTLWDSDGISDKEGKTAEEISEYGFKLFEEGGIYNIFHLYPELKEYIVNKEFLDEEKTKNLQGLSICSKNDLLDFIDSMLNDIEKKRNSKKRT